MAVDKLVDSAQLDSDLTSVANAIRTKGGTSAQLAFPTGFVSEIGNIQSGDPNENFRKAISNTLSEYIDDELTTISAQFPTGAQLKKIIAHNVTSMTVGPFNQTSIEYVAFPNLTSAAISYAFRSTNLKGVDCAMGTFYANYFNSCSHLEVLIIRYTGGIVNLQNVNAFSVSSFASGGAGGTIYIPKAFYDHLGDGTSLDYKAATNWSTIEGYGTITWAQIEGSIYETQYVDGTAIPTA